MSTRKKNKPFSVVTTFAGCGGSSKGYELAGAKVRLAVEWDDNAVATYRVNFPDTPVYHGDIAKLSVREALRLSGLKPGELDVLDGSPPCQGFSTSGKRSFRDGRNQLFREYVRLLQELQPKVFVMENVSGMVKGTMKLIFADILAELKTAGYKVKARLLNAMYFGVPQSRERVIFIGVRNDLNIEPTHPVGTQKPVSVREAIGDLSNKQDPRIDHIWIDESPSGRNTKTYAIALRAKQGQKYAGQQRRYHWNKPTGTITKASSEKMDIGPWLRNMGCHPIHTRTYSLLEFKRLQSFPDEFQLLGGLKPGIARIGNSVPPLFMQAIAEHIRDHILVCTK